MDTDDIDNAPNTIQADNDDEESEINVTDELVPYQMVKQLRQKVRYDSHNIHMHTSDPMVTSEDSSSDDGTYEGLLEKEKKRKYKYKFICYICGAMRSRHEDLDVHLAKHAPRKERYQRVAKLKRNANCYVSGDTSSNSSDSSTRRNVIDTEDTIQFVCAVCKKSAESRKYFNMHILIHHYCRKCGIGFETREGAIVHRTEECALVKDGAFCKVCQKVFADKESFEEHYLRHKSDPKFRCEQCFLILKCQFDLAEHLAKHAAYNLKNKHEKALLKCKSCGEGSLTPSAYIEHCKKVHATCEICHVVFNNKVELQVHVSKEHTRHSCKYCDAVLNSELELTSHMFDKHDFQCNICPQMFTNREELQEHVTSHPEAKICPFCKGYFKQQVNLDLHIRQMHSQKKHMCPFCKLVAQTNITLVEHIKTVHFQSNVCKSISANKKPKYRNIEVMISEMQLDIVNTEEYSLVCLLHDKQFSLKEDLLCHRQNWHSEFMFKCKLCEKSFFLLTSLVAHVMSHDPELCYICFNPCPEEQLEEHIAAEHSCELCKIVLFHQDLRELHTGEHEAHYSCKHCHEQFPNRYKMNLHLKSTHDFNCALCMMRFPTVDRLQKHMRHHEYLKIYHEQHLLGRDVVAELREIVAGRQEMQRSIKVEDSSAPASTLSNAPENKDPLGLPEQVEIIDLIDDDDEDMNKV